MLSTEKPSVLAGTVKPLGRLLASHYLVISLSSGELCGQEEMPAGWAAPSFCSKGIRFSSLSCQGKPLSKPVSILHVGRRLMLAPKLGSHSGGECECTHVHACL